MQRINVTGNAGVGKSTVAAELSRSLGLELVNLDRVVWQSGWRPTPPHERRQFEEEIAARSSWVVDGVSHPIRHAADTIVFLDYPRYISFLRCARRNWRYLFRSRPGLPDNCPEILIIPALCKLIWQFPKMMCPKILAEFESFRSSKTIFHIQNDRELAEFLQQVRQQGVHRTRASRPIDDAPG